jgi:Ca-activated chloride channel homolog
MAISSFRLALLAISCVCSLYAQHQPPIAFQVNAELVLVPVTVLDTKGQTVEGLRAEDFTVRDNQIPQPIVSFANEDAPCSVSLILDTSGSMKSPLSGAKNIAHAFFKSSNVEDEFRLFAVSTHPEALTRFTSDIAFLEQGIEARRSGGLTALIDTIFLALSSMREARNPRRALLILSDGMDNHSRYSERELVRLARESDVQVYSILVGNGSSMSADPGGFRPALIMKPWDAAREDEGPTMLEGLTQETGGLSFRIRNDAQATRAITKVARVIRDEYVIGYQPRPGGRNGKWHKVRVESDVPRVKVYARSGYYSP